MASDKNDFSKGPVWKCIVAQVIPLTIAQFVQLLYNVVDRIYIGHLGESDSLALTGIGLTFPIVTLILAFTALFGQGGVPLFGMARGKGDEAEASDILGCSFALLITASIVLTIGGYLFMRPILFAFGASETSYIYASQYLRIYLFGTGFAMTAAGLNGYINAQGFPRVGMLSTIISAALNIILDPILIFVLHLGVSGAALATVISQAFSAIWVLRFLTGKKALIRLSWHNIRISRTITARILQLGSSTFIMQATNSAVQVVCNSALQTHGGDLYVSIMTVANSVREVFTLPITGITSGSQPVLSFNYGASAYSRVIKGIRFNTCISCLYTLLAWILILLIPGFWFSLFSNDPQMSALGVSMLQIYFFGFVFMALQFAGQSVFQALGDARHAIFFSLFRKVIIVIPLTLLLPVLGFGIKGVFLAEPISNLIGGLACYTTMRMTIYRRLTEGKNQENLH